jgi:predicted transcriptional regulator
MARFLVDVPEEDVARLDALARAEGKSRAAILREAVTNYIANSNKDWLEAGFGLWAKYGFTEDGMDYQNRLREEWVREWDPEYDPAKQGSLPDEKPDNKDAAA